jgi:ABC-type lipoprotein export system ATPase subunit
VSFVGGFLDGVQLDLASGLNCLIGHRGTGKTTVLEFIRYALDAFPDGDGGQAAKKRVEGLVSSNLGDGRIRVMIETREGLEYIVDRTAVGDPLVLTPDGQPTDISLRSGGLFRVDAYSQNEVESIADSPLSQLALIDNFLGEEVEGLNGQIRRVQSDLTRSASSILPLEAELAKAGDELNTLPAVDAKLSALAGGAGQNAQVVNRAHAHKAMREREQQAVEASSELLQGYAQWAQDGLGKFTEQAEAVFAQDMLTGPNGKALREMLRGLRAVGHNLDGLFAQMGRVIKDAQDQLTLAASHLVAAHNRQEIVFRDLIQKHTEAQGKATERAQWERKRNDLLAKKRKHQEMQATLARLKAERQALLARLQELRDLRFALRQTIAERITAEVSSPIRVRVEQCGNRDRYEELLATDLKSAGIQHHIVAGKIASSIPPGELAEVVRKGDARRLAEGAELSDSQAAKVVATLTGSPTLLDIEAVELVDLPHIELLDGAEYKDSLALSTGQKCTSILPILLMKSENPLMVDQPEDNLDNRFIYDTVVGNILKVKAHRQMVLITHNPNIPVLGEAERVFVLTSDGARARKANEGSVDQCKTEIVTLLEGGEEAFIRRKERYKY